MSNKNMMTILNKYNEYLSKELNLDDDQVKEILESFIKANKKELTKREKKIKDKNAPKRSKSAYMFFCEETRPKLKKEELDFAATAAKLGEMWGALSDKQKKKFNDKAEDDKKRYQDEMANYIPDEVNNETKSSFKGKRAKTGYQLFSAEMRPIIREENLNISFKDMNKKLGSMWSNLTKEEKEEWNTKAKSSGDEAKLPKKTVKKVSKKIDEEELEEDVEEEIKKPIKKNIKKNIKDNEEEEDEEEEDEDDDIDYSKKSLQELKVIAKEKKIKGFYNMKKEDLIEAIESS
jgi:hypothetical protein